MYFAYSLLLTIAFILMSPLFFLRREKYAAGFSQRLGNYPEFKHDGRPVIWLHCVSVGETNAARPLVDALHRSFPSHRIVISTTTKTGQELAQRIFADKADAVFYFPFDWKFSVKRALNTFNPSLVLLMETEIWPRFIREAHLQDARVAIVNGRLSAKSFRRYSRVKLFVHKVLGFVDLALMQGERDAMRIKRLGKDDSKVKVTGNLKFDQSAEAAENGLTNEFQERFAINGERPLVIAASTHEPEEQWILDALEVSGYHWRLLIAPRHPERFEAVAELVKSSGYSMVRRSEPESASDKSAQIILLDSIGELRPAFPLADIVFVGGSLIPHGGQSILEPAAAGRAIITGPYTQNFEAVVNEFKSRNALVQVTKASDEFRVVDQVYEALLLLLSDESKRNELSRNALAVMDTNRGATNRTIEHLRPLLDRTNTQVLANS